MKRRRNAGTELLLRGLALAYGAVVKLRNRHYDRTGNVRRAALPVISVGNLTVGGTGKTPLVAWLATHLRASGHRPAIVSRGYGGRAGRGPLVVSDGSGPRLSSVVCGDEPFLLARSLTGVPVIVGSDRAAGVEAADHLGADVVVLDDGFQHRGLARDLDLVLLDATNPFGDDALLPCGLLREPLAALARADVVLITRSQTDERFAEIERVVRRHNVRAPILCAGMRSVGFFDAEGRPRTTPSRALAFCAIGNPAAFRKDLERQGVRLVAFETRRDHHRFSPRELAAFAAAAAAQDALLVTTEKDLARFGGGAGGQAPGLLVLRIEAVVYDPAPLVDAVGRILEGRA